MQTVKIIIEDGRIEQFNEEVMKEFDNFIGRSDIINSNFIKNFIAQKLTAHKELILKMVREKMLSKEDVRKFLKKKGILSLTKALTKVMSKKHK